MDQYTYLKNLTEEVDIPTHGIVSRPIYKDDHLRIVLFGMAAGEDMTEHTTSMEATIQFISGEADLTLGEECFEVQAGSWAQMKPRLPHSIHAKTDTQFILTLLKKSTEEAS